MQDEGHSKQIFTSSFFTVKYCEELCELRLWCLMFCEHQVKVLIGLSSTEAHTKHHLTTSEAGIGSVLKLDHTILL